VEGFRTALADASFDPVGRRAAILGAGGAARAVALALVEGRASTVFVVGRSPRRVEALVGGYRGMTTAGTTISWAQWGDGAFLRNISECELLVNCTPVGTRFTESEGRSPLPAELIPSGCLAFDLVYNPVETPFLVAAKSRKARTFGGLAMLVYQGLASFRLWTGRDASQDSMLKAAQQSMSAEGKAGGG
jgi:shikimate dehydrogenase